MAYSLAVMLLALKNNLWGAVGMPPNACKCLQCLPASGYGAPPEHVHDLQDHGLGVAAHRRAAAGVLRALPKTLVVQCQLNSSSGLRFGNW